MRAIPPLNLVVTNMPKAHGTGRLRLTSDLLLHGPLLHGLGVTKQIQACK